jgi:periplasmic divalent cation tolerance protein
MKASDFCIITTATDSQENADAITQLLLGKKLVACVQSTTIQSAYHWQKKIIRSEEILLQLKTKKRLFRTIQMEIEKLHTYDVPEIIMLPLEGANISYLQWIEDETIHDTTQIS